MMLVTITRGTVPDLSLAETRRSLWYSGLDRCTKLSSTEQSRHGYIEMMKTMLPPHGPVTEMRRTMGSL